MDERALLVTSLADLKVADERWQIDRLRVIQRARHLTALGVSVADICTVLGVSQATWFRRCQELEAALSAEGQARAQAGRDQVLAHVFDVEAGR